MTENRRTLTEELNSVLRAHALDAPEPNRVIDAVLADAAGRPAPGRRPRPHWLRRPNHLGNWVAAAMVVGLVTGVGALIVGSNPGSNKTSSSTAGAASAPVNGAMAAGSAAASVAQAGAPTPTAAAGSSRVDNSTACPGGTTPLTTSVFTLQDYDVDNYYCAATATSPSGSLVEVRTHEIPNARILATLVRPTQGLQVAYVSVVDNKIIVRAQVTDPVPVNALPAVPSPTSPAGASDSAGMEFVPAEPAGAGNGNVQEQTFTVNAEATVFTPASTEVIAKPCAKAAVSATIATRSATSAAIAVVNNSVYPCALTGYPGVRATDESVTAAQTLTGPSGGVSDSAVPPVVVIQPGGRATAIVELSTDRECGSSTLSVSLPGIGQVLTSLNGYGLCGLRVHPFVEGSTGSSG